MSDFAYFRFESLKLLTPEEERHKDEVISATEQVLGAKGIECDEECAKMSEEQTVKILEVRRIRGKKKKRVLEDGSIEELEDEQHDEKEVVYAGTG